MDGLIVLLHWPMGLVVVRTHLSWCEEHLQAILALNHWFCKYGQTVHVLNALCSSCFLFHNFLPHKHKPCHCVLSCGLTNFLATQKFCHIGHMQEGLAYEYMCGYQMISLTGKPFHTLCRCT